MEVSGITRAGLPQAAPPLAKELAESPFGAVVERFIGGANADQAQADAAVRSLVTGQANSVHEVALAVARAELSFRLLLEIRNRLIEAYQEITRLQV
ncbi:MAG: flagellar hook-basal body complex protein FliE [Gemmatales bacterium]|nr:MAG: flagellar hook-basal body complex protein FliE [Gemmatales bacterium]